MSSYSVEAVFKATGVGRFTQAFAQAERSVQGIQNAGSKIRNVGSQLSSVGGSLTNSITKPAMVATTATAALVGTLGFKRLMGVDSAKAKLKGLGYEGTDVDRIMKQVTSATKTGMTTVGEGADIAAGALAAGVSEGADLEKYIKLVGDAAVASNRPVDEMAQIFNRVQGGGRLMTMELNQIEHGMPGFSQAMAKHLGVPPEKMREMVTAGEVSSKDFLTVMDDFGGGMADAYSESMAGMLKNTLSYVGMIGEALIGGLFEDGKKGMAEFIEVLQSPAIMEWAHSTGEAIRDVVSGIVDKVSEMKTVWDGLSPSLQGAIGKFVIFGAIALMAIGPVLMIIGKLISGVGIAVQAFGFLQMAFTFIGSIITTLIGIVGLPWLLIAAGVAAAVAAIYIYWEPIKEFFFNLWESIKEMGIQLWENLTESWQETVELLKEIWSGIGEFFSDLWNGIKELGLQIWENLTESWIETVELFKQIWGTVSEFFSDLWNGIKELGMQIWENLTQSWRETVELLKSIWGTITEFFSMLWEGVKTIFTTVWNAIKEVVITAVNGIKTVISAVFTSIKTFFTTALTGYQNIFTTVWNAIKTVVTTVINGIKTVISTVFNVIKSIITSVLNAIRSTVTSVWNGIKSVITSVLGGISSVVTSVWNTIKSVITGVLNGIRSIVTSVFNAISSVISSIMSSISSTISSVWSAISSTVSSVTSSIRSTISSVFNALAGIVTGAMSGVKSAITSGMNAALSVVTNIGGQFKEAGSKIVSMIADGIKAAAGKVTGAAKDLMGKVRSFLPFSPAKEGPLRDLHKLNFGGTIADSIDRGQSTAVKAMNNMMENVRGVGEPGISLDTGLNVGNKVASINSQAERQLSHTFDSSINVGSQPIIIHTTVDLDGNVLAQSVNETNAIEAKLRRF